MGHDVPYLNTTQAGEYLGVHPRTIKRWIRDGLPAKRTPGGHYRIVRADLDAWLTTQTPAEREAS